MHIYVVANALSLSIFRAPFQLAIDSKCTMDKDEKGAEEAQETDSQKDTRGKTAKRKFVSQSQFDDLRSTVAGMQSEMSKLVSVLQDSVIPTKRLRSTEPNATTSQSEGLKNQFLANSNERQFRMLSNENQFLLHKMAISLPRTFLGISSPLFNPQQTYSMRILYLETSPLSLSIAILCASICRATGCQIAFC